MHWYISRKEPTFSGIWIASGTTVDLPGVQLGNGGMGKGNTAFRGRSMETTAGIHCYSLITTVHQVVIMIQRPEHQLLRRQVQGISTCCRSKSYVQGSMSTLGKDLTTQNQVATRAHMSRNKELRFLPQSLWLKSCTHSHAVTTLSKSFPAVAFPLRLGAWPTDHPTT